MATKRRKKHKNKISGFVISICYNEQKSNFRLFANPSKLANNKPLKSDRYAAVLHICRLPTARGVAENITSFFIS
jgi:hypothetical protein